MMQLLKTQIEDSTRIAAGTHLPNFSEAGTGKTLTTLEAIRKMGAKTGLVVAPPIALPMWKETIESYLGATAQIIKTGASPLKGDTDFYISSYGIVSGKDMFQKLYALGGDTLVLDESHYLKTATAKRTKAIYGAATNGRRGLFESFAQCLTLTGTPIAGHPNSLWSQLRATQPDALREYNVQNYEAFLYRYCVVRMRKFHPRARPTMSVVATKNLDELNRLLYDEIKVVRRELADVAKELPPITHRNVYASVGRNPELAASIAGLTIEELMEGMAAGDEGLMKPWRLLGMATAETTAEYVIELNQPTLVGYWHTDVGDAIESRLRAAGKTVGRISGSVSAGRRVKIQDALNAGNLDVLVGQMGAMGVSINLQKCARNVVIAQPLFQPDVLEQFIARVYRMGQENHVQIDHIVADHDVQTAIDRLRHRKAVAAEVILEQ